MNPSIPPVHVAGYSHTGTSLLVSMVRSHPEVMSVTSEHNFFTYLPDIQTRFPLNEEDGLRKYVLFLLAMAKVGAHRALTMTWAELARVVDRSRLDLDGTVVDVVGDAHRGRRGHLEVFFNTLDHLVRRAGRSTWVAKINPRVADRAIGFPVKQRLFGVIRDPRAVIASRKVRARKAGMSESVLLDAFRYRQHARCLDRLHAETPECVSIVRYEDLVANPETILTSVFGTIGLQFDGRTLRQTFSNSAYGDGARGIFTSSVDRWREALTPIEVELVQQVFAREMSAHRYEPVPTNLGWRAVGEAPTLILETARVGLSYTSTRVQQRLRR